MRTTFDFTPLFRAGVGFDRMLSALESASRVVSIDNWPPYDIVKLGQDDYRIVMAVAGFTADDLAVAQEQGLLIISGQKQTDGASDDQYLHRGIAGRSFQHRFELADHVKVTAADLENGLLSVSLKREIPEEMKPRRIAIATASALPRAETKQIESEKRVA